MLRSPAAQGQDSTVLTAPPPHPMILDPDYPHIVLSYTYRGARIELDQSEWHGSPIYAAWVSYATGTALAVPKAWTRSEALQRAQRWVDRQLICPDKG